MVTRRTAPRLLFCLLALRPLSRSFVLNGGGELLGGLGDGVLLEGDSCLGEEPAVCRSAGLDRD